MKPDRQRRYAELGNDYWWLLGKYAVVKDLMLRYLPPSPDRRVLLDLGCGPGNFLPDLKDLGWACGTDTSLTALALARERDFHHLFASDSELLAVKGGRVDVLVALDVIEHLDDDRRALREMHRVLKPGGLLVLTVPAFPVLWGDHDDLYGHRRRYKVPELRELLEDTGFRVERLTYFEPAFFLPLLIFRRAKRCLRDRPMDDFVAVPGWLNRILRYLIGVERFYLRRWDFPIGVSIVGLIRKTV